MNCTSKVHLYLLGAGICGTLQLTRETEQALSSCSTIFVLHDDTDVLAHARRYCADVRDVAEFYSDGAVRADVYRRIADTVIDHAGLDRSVGLLLHGHPLFLVSAAEYALEQARRAGFRAKVLPAVSSFDTLLCDLEVDFGYGLQVFDASTFLLQEWRPNPRIPMLLFQLATVLEDRVVSAPPPPQTLAPLATRLRHSYPADHRCVMVRSAAHLLERPQRVTVRLDALDRAQGIPLWERPTLYVPAIDHRA